MTREKFKQWVDSHHPNAPSLDEIYDKLTAEGVGVAVSDFEKLKKCAQTAKNVGADIDDVPPDLILSLIEELQAYRERKPLQKP